VAGVKKKPKNSVPPGRKAAILHPLDPFAKIKLKSSPKGEGFSPACCGRPHNQILLLQRSSAGAKADQPRTHPREIGFAFHRAGTDICPADLAGQTCQGLRPENPMLSVRRIASHHPTPAEIMLFAAVAALREISLCFCLPLRSLRALRETRFFLCFLFLTPACPVTGTSLPALRLAFS
jgi:hypothetical protein